LAGYKSAVKYGYASTRVKAMEAKLISGSTMQEIAKAKAVSGMLAILFHTDYEKDITAFGGLSIKSSLIDFALSKNVAKHVEKLVSITPKEQRHITATIIGKWGMYNVKLLLEAVDRHLRYEDIEKYIIDYGPFGAGVIKEAIAEEGVEAALSKLIAVSPRAYVKILRGAVDLYKSKKDVLDAIAGMDNAYYAQIGKIAEELSSVDANAAKMLKMDIDMKNALVMIKAKRRGMNYSDIEGNVISKGLVSKERAERIYDDSKDVAELAQKIGTFDLKDRIDMYAKDNRLIHLEIGMNNHMLKSSFRLLRHSVLSFASLVAYVYLKELEVSTLRILLKSKQYGLSEDEVSGLMVWHQ